MARPTRTPGLPRQVKAALVTLVIAFCIGVILGLVSDVERRLDALARASSDSVQWSLAQLEVETQLMREALAAPDADLAEVRKRFDIFYSRVVIFETSALYAGLRERPEFEEERAAVGAFVTQALPLIDGPDALLRAALPSLAQEAADLRSAVRSMALIGIDHFATESDRQRSEMARTLRDVAALTGLLIVALLSLAIVLQRLYQRSRQQAVENRLTTARLETIVATSVDAIVVVNRRGIVLEFNPAAETIFGFARDEAIGRRVTNLIFPPDAVSDTIEAIETQLISPEALSARRQRIELEAVRKDRTRFPTELSVARAENAEGEIFVAFIRDISNRRQAEQDLTEARDQALKGERAKAEFLAVMSHEMRTPLNGLLGSVDILGATPLADSQREILEVIETSGQVLLHHVNSVLDISSAEASPPRLAQTPFVIEALVREVVANQSGLAAAGGSRIGLTVVTEPAGRVTGDPARLRQILLNLVGNAVKFTRNGTITVEIEAEPAERGVRMVEFRVIDSGIGIAEGDQARVFDDFVTLDSSYGRETGGTGLGLGITRRLVRALGGEIGMESELGQGSVFWVRLPFGVEPPGLVAPHDPPAADGNTLSGRVAVLVIEDNAINRFVLRALLEEINHVVTEAVDGLEGVAEAEANPYDVILMDISMPRLDGVEAARRIRAGTGKSRDARIIAVTAHALPEELDRFRTAGIDDHLIKPVTRGTLARALSGRAPEVFALPQEPDRPVQSLIDESQLNDLFARLDRSTADDLMRRFIGEGDTIVPLLSACPPAPDFDRLAHRLAGSAATFGALRLAGMLGEIAVGERTEGELSYIQATLPETWASTRDALEKARQARSATV